MAKNKGKVVFDTQPFERQNKGKNIMNKGRGNKSFGSCFNCKKQGHTAKVCCED